MTLLLERVESSLKMHNYNLVGELDVPPDSDAHGDQLQSIKKTLKWLSQSMRPCQSYEKSDPFIGFPHTVWLDLYVKGPAIYSSYNWSPPHC